MEIKTKFNVGQYVYTMFLNNVVHHRVKQIDISISYGYDLKARCDMIKTRINYILDRGANGADILVYEENLFATKDDLIKSL